MHCWKYELVLENILDFEQETAGDGQLILDSESCRRTPTTEPVLPDEAATTDA